MAEISRLSCPPRSRIAEDRCRLKIAWVLPIWRDEVKPAMQRSLDVRSGAAKQTDDDDDGVEVPRDGKHERQQSVKAPLADGYMCTDTAKSPGLGVT